MSDRSELAQRWLAAKAAEKTAAQERLAIEKRMLDATFKELPEKGTFHACGVKIYIGQDTIWDQDALRTIKNSWSEIAKHLPFSFPFREEYKPDQNTLQFIRESYPEAWAKFFEPASRMKPKKPAFSAE